jgi:POT family proton-dependent oligopeptide transporter
MRGRSFIQCVVRAQGIVRDSAPSPTGSLLAREFRGRSEGFASAEVFCMSFISRLKEHPRGFWFVFWGELAERSSYYGMRTLLALYLVDVIGFEKHRGAFIVHTFIATCYLLPLAGGFIADRWLGRYKTIVYFSLPYIMGHILLGLPSHIPGVIYFALFLLAAGSGTIKPSTSPLMGLIYEKSGKKNLLPEAFSYFYLAINIGSLFSTFALPKVRDHFMPATGWTPASMSIGYQVALAFPTLLMVVALFVFAIGKRYYPSENVGAQPKKTPEQKKAEIDTLLRIGGIFLIIIFWWFVYDQYADVWIYFAKDHMDLRVWPFDVKLTADQVQFVNPLFILLFTPIFNWQWNWMAKRRSGVPVPVTQRMLLGFILTLATTLILTGIAIAAQNGATPSIWWQILAFAILTYAELCVSMLGLAFAYEQALPGTKSVVTAFFFLTIWAGDTLGAFYGDRYEHGLSPVPFFGLQIPLMVVCTVAFWWVARRFERGEIPEDRGEEPAVA